MKRLFVAICIIFTSSLTAPITAQAAGSDCISLGYPSVTSSASAIRVSVTANSKCKTPFGLSNGGGVYTILDEPSSSASCSGPYDFSNFGGGTINCTISLGGASGSSRAYATSSTIQIWFAYDFSTKQITFSHPAIPSKTQSGSSGGGQTSGGSSTPATPSCTAAPNTPVLTVDRNSLGPKFNYSLANTGQKATTMFWSYALWDSNSKSWGAWSDWQSTSANTGSYQASVVPSKSLIAFAVYARNSCGSSSQARESEEGSGISLAAQETDVISRNVKSTPKLKVGLDVDLYLIATSKFDLELTAVTSTPKVCSIDSTQIVLNSKGTCKLLVSSVSYGLESGAKPTEIEFEISERESQQIPEIEFKSQYTLSDYLIEIDQRAASGLAIDFESLTPQICEVMLGYQLYLQDVGKCILRASQEGNEDFLPAPTRDFELVIVPDRTRKLTCTKGKLVKKLTGKNPKCPAGYKVKK